MGAMSTHRPNTLEHILYGSQEIEARAHAHAAPSSAPMLVSLFLILITFFVVMNKNANPDKAKSKIVFEKLQEKFGRADDDMQSFAYVMPPKVEEFTVKLQNALGDNGKVESNIEGTETTVTFSKELFFYSDETEIRADKAGMAKRISDIMQQMQGQKPLSLSIIAESGNFELDNKKLISLKNAIGITSAETGMKTQKGSNFMLIIENE